MRRFFLIKTSVAVHELQGFFVCLVSRVLKDLPSYLIDKEGFHES